MRAGAGNAYADWLRYNPEAHLVILAGKNTQEDDSKGIQEIYFNPIRDQVAGTDMRDRILVCNYDADHYSIFHAGQYWLKRTITDSCPTLNYNGKRWTPTAWHP